MRNIGVTLRNSYATVIFLSRFKSFPITIIPHSDFSLLSCPFHAVYALVLLPIRDQQTVRRVLHHVQRSEKTDSGADNREASPHFFGKHFLRVWDTACQIDQAAVVHKSRENKEIEPDQEHRVAVRHRPDLLDFSVTEEIR